MNTKKNKIIGFVILLVVLIAVVIYSFTQNSKPKQITAKGLIGSEKLGLFENEDFKSTTNEKYGLTFDVNKAGTYDQVNLSKEQLEKYDFLFPSNQVALEVFKNNGHKSNKSEIAFNTPIVLYTRKVVADALIKQNIVTENKGIYEVNMKKLAELVKNETSWNDIDVDIYGNVLIDTTDPNKSNSGNVFLALLANSLNDGKVVDETSLNEIKTEIKTIYNKLGYMQSNSQDIFDQFLRQGVGAYPIIAGYENQILEFSKQNPEVFNKVKDDVVIMYPSPTVWSSHVFISLTENGNVALDSLMDEDIQNIAWQQHGFRTGVAGATNVSDFDVKGLKPDITNVMPMPNIKIMNELLNTIN